MDKNINSLDAAEIRATRERDRRAESASGIPPPLSKLQKKSSPGLSRDVSAAVYAAVLGTSRVHSGTVDRDTVSYQHKSESFNSSKHSTTRLPLSHTLEKGLREKMASSRRVIRNPGGAIFGTKMLVKNDISCFKEDVISNLPNNSLSVEDRNEMKHEDGLGRQGNDTFESKVWEVLDIEDHEIDDLVEDFRIDKTVPNIESSEKIRSMELISKDVTEDTHVNGVCHKSNKRFPISKKNRSNKRKRCRNFLKMKYAKVYPIEVPDDKKQEVKSQEYLAKIANMFCTEKLHPQNPCPKKTREGNEEDEDVFFRAGVWECEFLDTANILPNDIETIHAHKDRTPEINSVQENCKVNRDSKEKKKGNRFVNFFRKIFKKK